MFGRAMMLAGGDIAADHGADRFEPLPAHVAVMGVRHQRQPLRPRLAANLHAASGAISRRGSRSTRVDHAAHLDELLPIPAIAGEARDFAGANGADLAEADLRHHSLEASAC